MPTELNVKLALEDAWMFHGIILLGIMKTEKIKKIKTKKTLKKKKKKKKKKSVLAGDETWNSPLK